MSERNGAGRDVSILGLSNALLRNWRVIAVCMTLAGLGALLVTFGPKPKYVAESSFVTHSEQPVSAGLSGLAAQLGMNVGLPSSAPSLDFYARLLRSRGLLMQVIATPAMIDEQGERARSLAVHYGMADLPDDRRVRAVLRRLRRDISVSIDPKSKIVTLRTYATSPAVAETLNHRLLVLLDEFNQTTRQSQAAAERRFAEGRMAEAQEELRRAENALQSFYARNQRYRESSQLSFEAGRLERDVAQRQELYVTLAQAYDRARIDEVRNTPVITVVDMPQGSAMRRRGFVRNLGLGLLLGIAVGILLTIMREAIAYDRGRYPEEYEEFLRLRRLTGRRLGRRVILPAATAGRQQRDSD